MIGCAVRLVQSRIVRDVDRSSHSYIDIALFVYVVLLCCSPPKEKAHSLFLVGCCTFDSFVPHQTLRVPTIVSLALFSYTFIGKVVYLPAQQSSFDLTFAPLPVIKRYVQPMVTPM